MTALILVSLGLALIVVLDVLRSESFGWLKLYPHPWSAIRFYGGFNFYVLPPRDGKKALFEFHRLSNWPTKGWHYEARTGFGQAA